ncbi:hypothetical protein IAU60_003766 [Kwoniella sp. DSM 27419]
MLRTPSSALTRAAIRTLSTSAVARQEAVGVVGAVPVKKPVGGFRADRVADGGVPASSTHRRGGILGFFFGFSFASALSIYYLQQENKVASGLLLASVEELQQGTGKITSHLERLQAVEKEIAALRSGGAIKDDVTKVRGEMKKVYDGLHLELLDLRAHVWGVEQDLQKVVKTESIRI